MKSLLSILAGMLVGLLFMLLPLLNAQVDDNDPLKLLKAENQILRQDNQRSVAQNQTLRQQVAELKRQLAMCQQASGSSRMVQNHSPANHSESGTDMRPLKASEYPREPLQAARETTASARTPASIERASTALKETVSAPTSTATCAQRQRFMQVGNLYQPGTAQLANRFRSVTFSVQLASFQNLCGAEEMAQQANSYYPNQDVFIFCKNVKGKAYYAVVMGQVSSYEQADTYRNNLNARPPSFLKGKAFPLAI